MEFTLAENLSKKLQININNIVREYWEMFILNELYASSLASVLIFKGGTALRLIYNSPKFSEDLDFSLIEKINFKDFEEIIKKIVASQSELSVKEIASKRYTYFALIKFQQNYLIKTLSIKIEISKRKTEYKNFNSLIASSPTSNFKPLLKVFTLDHILKDKFQALLTRRKARDLFDAWFIKELLRNKQIILPDTLIVAQNIKQELHKLLPKNYHSIISELIKYAKKNK